MPPDYGRLAAHAPSTEKAGVQADFGDNSESREKKPTLSFEGFDTEDVIKKPSLLTQPELALAPSMTLLAQSMKHTSYIGHSKRGLRN